MGGTLDQTLVPGVSAVDSIRAEAEAVRGTRSGPVDLDELDAALEFVRDNLHQLAPRLDQAAKLGELAQAVRREHETWHHRPWAVCDHDVCRAAQQAL